ncbi:MAG: hypothetical protein PVF45_13210 [Anaerolineae bacterium]|jgi:hypothetical protein
MGTTNATTEIVEVDLVDLSDWLRSHNLRLYRSFTDEGDLIGEAVSVPDAAPLVGLTGSQEWPDGDNGLIVERVVAALLRAGRHIATGCAVGADQAAINAVLQADQAQRLTVYAAFGPQEQGSEDGLAVDTVRRAFDAGAHVHWWAGASRWLSPHKKARLPLDRRLANCSQALVRAVAGSAQKQPGAGLVAFAAAPPPRLLPESGSWATVAAAAARKEVPVVVFATGFPEGRLPQLPGGEGRWVRAGESGVWVMGWRWAPG